MDYTGGDIVQKSKHYTIHTSAAIATGPCQSLLEADQIAITSEPERSDSSTTVVLFAVAHQVPASIGWVRNDAGSVCPGVHAVTGPGSIGERNSLANCSELSAIHARRKHQLAIVTGRSKVSGHIRRGRASRLFGGIRCRVGHWVGAWVGSSVGGWLRLTCKQYKSNRSRGTSLWLGKII